MTPGGQISLCYDVAAMVDRGDLGAALAVWLLAIVRRGAWGEA